MKPSPVPIVRSSRRTSRLSGERFPKFPNLESGAEEKTPTTEHEQHTYIEPQIEEQDIVTHIYTDISGIELGDQTTVNLFAPSELLVSSQAEEAEMFTGELHLSCNEELDASEIIASTQSDAGATDADAVFGDLLVNENDILGDGDINMSSSHLFGDFAEPWY